MLNTSRMNDVWKRIKAEVARKPDGATREMAWLAERLQMKIQRVNNWATRGVPTSAFPAIAAALGWTLDDVAGVSTVDGRPPWPLDRVDRDRWDSLSREDQAYVQGVLNSEIDARLRSGNYSPNTHGSVSRVALQRDTPNGRSAQPPVSPTRLTADQAHSVGTVEGGSSDSSHQDDRVEGKANRGRPARTTGKGRKR